MKIKKIIALLAVLTLVVSVFASCSSKGTNDDTTLPSGEDIGTEENAGGEEELAGGYTVNGEIPEAKLPEDVKTAFDKALEGMTGVSYTPVAYLGSQVVAGANYAILCTASPVVPNAKASLKVVVVCDGVNGETSVLRINDFKLLDYVGADEETDENKTAEKENGQLAGGWTVNEEFGEAVLDDSVKAACDNTLEGIMGTHYEPIACLASQVVAGANYAVLCKATMPAADDAVELRVVTIYAGVDGSYEVLGTKTLNVAELAGAQE